MTIQLIHGDCLQELKKIPDKSVDLILTDPPYGISFQSAKRIESKRFDIIENDDVILVEWLNDAFRILKDDSAIYLFTRWDVYPQWGDTSVGWQDLHLRVITMINT